jgi:hypothetical protein
MSKLEKPEHIAMAAEIRAMLNELRNDVRETYTNPYGLCQKLNEVTFDAIIDMIAVIRCDLAEAARRTHEP